MVSGYDEVRVMHEDEERLKRTYEEALRVAEEIATRKLRPPHVSTSSEPRRSRQHGADREVPRKVIYLLIKQRPRHFHQKALLGCLPIVRFRFSVCYSKIVLNASKCL